MKRKPFDPLTRPLDNNHNSLLFWEEETMTRDQEIANIYSKLSSPQFNALRLRVKVQESEDMISPWCEATPKKDQDSAELEPDSKRD
jgi:hypothetical protein